MVILFISVSAGAQWKFSPLQPEYFERNMYRFGGVASIFDIAATPIHYHVSLDEFQDIVVYEHSYLAATPLLLSYEARFNVLTYSDRLSFSITLPPSLGLNFMASSPARSLKNYNDFETNLGDIGFFTIRLPMLIQWNFLFLSTYNNINDVGFHVGYGRQFNMSPLFAFEMSEYMDEITSLSLFNRDYMYFNHIIRTGVLLSTEYYGDFGLDFHLAFGLPAIWNLDKVNNVNQFTIVLSRPLGQVIDY